MKPHTERAAEEAENARKDQRFEMLEVFEDPLSDRDGALNMALDEVLLRRHPVPWVRFYGWQQPTQSIGYFEKPPGDANAAPWVRRWTGGGAVEHGGAMDHTFALGVPSTVPFSSMKAAESYQWIHQALVGALQGAGVTCRLAASELPAAIRDTACFTAPVTADVLAQDGQKLAGGAQRRTRAGFLHQGSVQSVAVLPEREFAQRLGIQISYRSLPDGALDAAEDLAEEKYRSPQWREGRRR